MRSTGFSRRRIARKEQAHWTKQGKKKVFNATIASSTMFLYALPKTQRLRYFFQGISSCFFSISLSLAERLHQESTILQSTREYQKFFHSPQRQKKRSGAGNALIWLRHDERILADCARPCQRSTVTLSKCLSLTRSFCVNFNESKFFI